ncbi:MAG TPA: DinB family protein [Longimicrobiales bacterium]|nr:DinB family protein [Longimicrobiales bacterium]
MSHQEVSQPEVWLRGPVQGVPVELQPVAHALLQALEDVRRLAADLQPETLWRRPGGAASIGFHLRHMTGSLDRLLTYARGEALSDGQRAALAAEHGADASVAELLEAFEAAVAGALDQLRATAAADLDAARAVGRAGLPSSVRGLLYHAGEHTARHAGQISTTRRILDGLAAG